jgi:hypothetical protein
VKLPGRLSSLADCITRNPKFAEFFVDCIGAIDSSHIYARVAPNQHVRFRDRHANISQNVLAVCRFNELFTYVMSGWEGSASDALIYVAARRWSLAIPEGKYLLGDAGFPSCLAVLVPYRGVQYHLKEWGRASERYASCLQCIRNSINNFLVGLRHSKNYSIFDMRSFAMSSSVYLGY